ncbi:MAG: hypothetical protein CW342_06045 [Thermoactinomycetaceae bacterium]|nr:hypothetical protein [Bacillota bacterium]MBO2532444.1 hypothetical protein [Thermoactinomycetaceae bacterium]
MKARRPVPGHRPKGPSPLFYFERGNTIWPFAALTVFREKGNPRKVFFLRLPNISGPENIGGPKEWASM